jgi:hypothetical protein
MALPSLDTYLSLITSLYRGKPKFIAWCSSLAGSVVNAQALLDAVRKGFDLDTAVGLQLDQIGEWVGRSRYLETPLEGVYFSWGVAGVGWGQGSWKGPYDPETGLVSLPDDAYRTLLRAKIAANAWDGTVPGAYTAWETAFAETGSMIIVQDNQDMSMIIGVAGVYPDAVTKALLTGGYIPLKPEGVRISFYAVPPEGGAIFAWGCNSDGLNGWGLASWPEIIVP